MAEHAASMSSAKAYENVQVSFLKEDGSVETVSDEIPFKIEISQEKTNTVISILNGEFPIVQTTIDHVESGFHFQITFSSISFLHNIWWVEHLSRK